MVDLRFDVVLISDVVVDFACSVVCSIFALILSCLRCVIICNLD